MEQFILKMCSRYTEIIGGILNIDEVNFRSGHCITFVVHQCAAHLGLHWYDSNDQVMPWRRDTLVDSACRYVSEVHDEYKSGVSFRDVMFVRMAD